MTQQLLLLISCFGMAFSVPPGPVTDLKAVQEGFDGMISLSWERPSGFPTACNDFYNFTITDSNNETVEYHLFTKAYGNETTAIFTVQRSIEVGETLKIEVTSVQAESAQIGGSAAVMLIMQGEVNAIPKPTNFQYAGLNYGVNYLQWEWNVNNTTEYKNVWFFVGACVDEAEMDCVQATTTNTSIVLSGLGYNSYYNVMVVAHMSGPRDSDPVRTSVVLNATMTPIAFSEFPGPSNSEIVRSNEVATLDQISYTVNWTMEPRLPNQTLRGMALQICDKSISTSPCGPLQEPTDGYVENVTVSLEYGADYVIHCYAVYDMGLNQTYNRNGSTVMVSTPNGRSHRVRNLTAAQDDTMAVVIIAWELPEKTNGDLSHYTIELKSKNGTKLEQSKRLDAKSARTTVFVKNPKYGQIYNISVVPVTKARLGNPDLNGEPANTSVVLRESRGLPVWGFAIIVVVVILAIKEQQKLTVILHSR